MENMNRRDFLKLSGYAAAALATGRIGYFVFEETRPYKPKNWVQIFMGEYRKKAGTAWDVIDVKGKRIDRTDAALMIEDYNQKNGNPEFRIGNIHSGQIFWMPEDLIDDRYQSRIIKEKKPKLQ